MAVTCITQFYKIKPTHTLSYCIYEHDRSYNRSSFTKQLRKSNPVLSDKSQKQLRNCFNWIRIISNPKEVYCKTENKIFTFKLNFITLTLSDVQIHSDDYIKEHLLQPFLRWLQRAWNVNSYIWKAEAQNNGNIHFHITTNKFVHWKSVRSKWNMLLSNHGYCKVFQDGTNDKGNAATEVKAVRKEKEISSYMLGYISKKDLFKKIYCEQSKSKKYYYSDSCPINNHFYMKQNYRVINCTDGTSREYKRFIEGRLWGASTNLNQTGLVISELDEDSEFMHNALQHDGVFKKKESDFCTVYLYKAKATRYFPDAISKKIKDHVKQLRKEDEIQTRIEIESIY